MPSALSIGITFEEFGTLNPRKLDIYLKAYKKRMLRSRQDMNLQAYIQGIYFGRALGSAFGKVKYPDKPIELFEEEKELTEEEAQKQTEAFFMSLEIMQKNFENSQKKKESNKGES